MLYAFARLVSFAQISCLYIMVHILLLNTSFVTWLVEGQRLSLMIIWQSDVSQFCLTFCLIRKCQSAGEVNCIAIYHKLSVLM